MINIIKLAANYLLTARIYNHSNKSILMDLFNYQSQYRHHSDAVHRKNLAPSKGIAFCGCCTSVQFCPLSSLQALRFEHGYRQLEGISATHDRRPHTIALITWLLLASPWLPVKSVLCVVRLHRRYECDCS